VQERQLGGLSKSRAREIDRLFEHAPVTPRGEPKLTRALPPQDGHLMSQSDELKLQ
jgi:hypothetical protein